jgi:GDPmannose 4,6-dehydratase
MNSLRDWGHARDYVEMQWLMLQQDKPEDFVIATGVQYSVRDFVNAAAKELGITLRWEGEGVDEIGVVESVKSEESGVGSKESNPSPLTSYPSPGDVIVRVDPRYFRPTEVETLLGDPTKAKEKLGWTPKTSFEDLVAEMVRGDFEEAQKDELCRRHGFNTFNYHE